MDAAVEKRERTYRQTGKQADGGTSQIKMCQFLRNVENPLTTMLHCSKCRCEMVGMILLQIFLQNCSLMEGVILDLLIAYFSDTAIV